MAAAKKTTTVKAVETKAAAPAKIEAAAPAKALEAKVEAPKAEEKKAEAEATPVETAPAKKTVKKAAKKTVKTVEAENAAPAVKAEEKPAEKKPGRKPGRKPAAAKQEAEPKKTVKAASARKETLKTNICVQFAGKSYSNEDLVKIAQDVWQYDLKKDVKDLKTVDLYVKPEESNVYYVFNGTEDGCFGI